MWKPNKSKEEIEAFIKEIFVDNGPRYKKPAEWHHLWVDFWVAFFAMSYTLGHIVGIGLPILAFILLLPV